MSAAKSTYRDQSIYTLSAPFNTRSLLPLIPETKISRIALIDNFLILAQQQETLEQVIANYQNNTTLSSQNWWIDAKKKMSTSSTLLNITSVEQLKNPFISIDSKDQKVLKEIDQKSIKALISQYVHEDG